MTNLYRQHKTEKFLEAINIFLKIKKVKNVYSQHKKSPDPSIHSITENIAFIINDEVVEIIHCQERLASILLSSPKIVSVEDKSVRIGYKYLDEQFINPYSVKSTYPHE
jgi:hypothetical protein